MSESEKADRRSRIVMALGIATVILFSANLLAMVAKHFWPDLRETALFRSESAVDEVEEVHEHVIQFHSFADADHRHRHVYRSPRKVIIRKPHTAVGSITFNGNALENKLRDMEMKLSQDLKINGPTLKQHQFDSDLDRSLLELEDRLANMQAELEHELNGKNSPLKVRINGSRDGSSSTWEYTISEINKDAEGAEKARQDLQRVMEEMKHRNSVELAELAAQGQQAIISAQVHARKIQEQDKDHDQ